MPKSDEPRQLPLAFRWDDGARLESFHPGCNAGALAVVERLVHGHESLVYLHGHDGAGKSHLLQAACRAMVDASASAAYVPLTEIAALEPALLDGLESMALVAVDDIEAIVGHAAWEEALFHTFNRCRDTGCRMLVAGGDRPERLGVHMPDLVSRLQWGVVHRLEVPDDAGKLAALRHRAALRGLEVPEESGTYLLRRYPRDPRSLFALLDELDTAALAAQRRLTVPFLRSVLGKRGSR